MQAEPSKQNATKRTQLAQIICLVVFVGEARVVAQVACRLGAVDDVLVRRLARIHAAPQVAMLESAAACAVDEFRRSARLLVHIYALGALELLHGVDGVLAQSAIVLACQDKATIGRDEQRVKHLRGRRRGRVHRRVAEALVVGLQGRGVVEKVDLGGHGQAAGRRQNGVGRSGYQRATQVQQCFQYGTNYDLKR